MRLSGLLKHCLLAFAIALLVYVLTYSYIENRRTRKGPWLVTFASKPGGAPTLIINQPSLNISNAQITFPAENSVPTNDSQTFRIPEDVPFNVPFGSCIFEDTTFLPGTIVFHLFDHEVQLIPRVLTVDRREYPWKSGSTLAFTNQGVLKRRAPR
jgi:hypothetical protein